jgi:hypothetical protein
MKSLKWHRKQKTRSERATRVAFVTVVAVWRSLAKRHSDVKQKLFFFFFFFFAELAYSLNLKHELNRVETQIVLWSLVSLSLSLSQPLRNGQL